MQGTNSAHGAFSLCLIVLLLLMPSALWAQTPPKPALPAAQSPQQQPKTIQPLGEVSGADSARTLAPVRGEGSVSIANGYVRLVLLMDEFVPSTTRVSAGVLVITFKRPVAISTERLAADLSDYVSVIRRDPDGMGLRMALTRRVTVNTMEAGERLFIDMLPDGWKGPPPSLPQSIVDDLARRAREAEKKIKQVDLQKMVQQLPPITVRVGNHPTFTRFVFGMPEQTPVMVDRSSDRLMLRFDKPYPIDVGTVRSALPWYIGGIEANHNEDSMVVRMVIAPEVDVRAFREEGTYVLDISTREPRVPETTPAGPAVENAKQKESRPNETQFPGEESNKLPPKAAPAVEPPKPKPAEKQGALPEPSSQPLADAMSAPKPTPTPAKPKAEVSKSIELPVAQEQVTLPATDASGTAPVQLQVMKNGDTYRIVAPFTKDVPSAIFQRGDTLWMVFGPGSNLDLTALQSEQSGAFRSVDAARDASGTAIRIGLDHVRAASATRDGMAWIVTLADRALEPPRPVSLARANGPNDKQLASADFEEPAGIHRVADPLAGDELIVVTGRGQPRSFVRSQDYVEFSALPGAHGLVFQPLADDISVEMAGNRVMVLRPNGLIMSSGVAQSSGAGRMARRSVAAMFDSQVWRFDRDAPFNERQSDLMSVAAAAHETQRTQRRLDIARFYMARDLWVEAKSVLDAILMQDKRTADDGSLQILKAIIDVKINRLDDAMNNIGHVAVAGTQDAQLWRSVIQSMKGQHAQAMEGFKSTDTVIASLPDTLRRDVLAQAAETALALNELSEASRRLSEIEEMGPATGLEGRLQFLQGRLLLAKGQGEAARTAFSAASNGVPSVWQADAELQLVLMDEKAGKLSNEQLIGIYDRMAYGWRGDHVEAHVLMEFGKNLALAGRYRDAFNVAKSALINHPTSDYTRALQDQMMVLFEDIFLGDKGKTMKPVDALALFYDFQQMVPQSRKGDEIVRQLADRHVELDMLDQAAKLLQLQINERYRNAPVARAQLGARLALIHMINRKPDQAIAVLKGTRVAELPETLREQRYLIEAQALGKMGRHEQALDLISDMKSRDAQLVKFDLLWGAQNWQQAGEFIEQYLQKQIGPTTALTDADRKLILRGGIAYALASEPLGLDRIASKFSALMKGSPDERTFSVITSPIEARGVEFREIAKSLAGLDTFEAFMENYKARYPGDVPGNTTPIDFPDVSAAPSPAKAGETKEVPKPDPKTKPEAKAEPQKPAKAG